MSASGREMERMGNLGGKKCRIFPRLDRIRTFNPRHFVTVSEICSLCPNVTGWMNGPAKCTFVVVRCTEGRRLSNANGNNGIYDGAVEALSSLFPQFFAEKKFRFSDNERRFPAIFSFAHRSMLIVYEKRWMHFWRLFRSLRRCSLDCFSFRNKKWQRFRK